VHSLERQLQKSCQYLAAKKIGNKSEIADEVNNFVYRDWASSGHEPSLLVSIPLKVKKSYLYESRKELKQELP
jgi:hypothetical protein